jgi:hypothetical protein
MSFFDHIGRWRPLNGNACLLCRDEPALIDYDNDHALQSTNIQVCPNYHEKIVHSERNVYNRGLLESERQPLLVGDVGRVPSL